MWAENLFFYKATGIGKLGLRCMSSLLRQRWTFPLPLGTHSNIPPHSESTRRTRVLLLQERPPQRPWAHPHTIHLPTSSSFTHPPWQVSPWTQPDTQPLRPPGMTSQQNWHCSVWSTWKEDQLWKHSKSKVSLESVLSPSGTGKDPALSPREGLQSGWHHDDCCH